MPRFVLAFPLFALLALTAARRKRSPSRSPTPSPVQRSKVTSRTRPPPRPPSQSAGRSRPRTRSRSKSLVYIDEIIENPKNAKRPTKLKRTFEKAVVAQGRDSKLNLPVEGKTVLIEKKGEKYSFTVDGKGVTGDALRILDDEFNRPGRGDVRDIMFPKKPVKPGESWKIDPEELIKAIGEQGPTFDKDKVTATGTLVKAYKKDGQQFGVIEFSFEAPLTGLGAKNPVTVKEGKMIMKLSGDGCIDGTVATGKSTTKMSLDLTGSTMGVDLKVAVENTEDRTVEALPKK